MALDMPLSEDGKARRCEPASKATTASTTPEKECEARPETVSTATTAATTPEKESPGGGGTSAQSSSNDVRMKLGYLLAPSVPQTNRLEGVESQQAPGFSYNAASLACTTNGSSRVVVGKALDEEISALRAENEVLRAQLCQHDALPCVLGIKARQCGGCQSSKAVYSRAFVQDKRLYCQDCWDRWERCGWWHPTMRVSTAPPTVGAASGLPEFSGEDAFVLPGFICAHDDFSLLERLRNGLPAGKDFSDWHGARHLGMHFGAEDTSGLRMASAPEALRETVAKLEAAFGIRASAARLNLYRSTADYKPMHADRGRDEDGVPQVTVGLSLGATRELSFMHWATGLTTSFPQSNGDVFAFTPELNQVFLHGVPKVRAEQVPAVDDAPRMSLILWGARIVVQQAADAAKTKAEQIQCG